MKLSLNIVSILISLVAVDLDVYRDRGAGTGTGTGRVDAFTTCATRVKIFNPLAAKTESTEFEPHPPDSPPPSELLTGDASRPFFADALGGGELDMDTEEDNGHEELELEVESEPDVEPVLEVELEPAEEPEVEVELELELEPTLQLDIEETPEVIEILEEPSEPIISEPIISKETQEELAKMSKKLAETIGELVTAELIVSNAHVLGHA
jgi:hypothetical protein